MFDPVKDADTVIDAMDALNINLEVAKQCLSCLQHLDDSAATVDQWQEIRRGVMLLVNQVEREIDCCRETIEPLL